jgi:hypothetical protein
MHNYLSKSSSFIAIIIINIETFDSNVKYILFTLVSLISILILAIYEQNKIIKELNEKKKTTKFQFQIFKI